MPVPCRAFLKLGALALLLSPANPPKADAQVVETHEDANSVCPSSDLRTAVEIRREIDKYVDHAIAYPSIYKHTAELIGFDSLPKLLITSDRTEALRLLWNAGSIENSADLNTAFHLALSTKNASLMRAVATSNVRRTRTQTPFLAPTADLPALALLYVKLFERSPDLLTTYQKLAGSALAEAKQVGSAPLGMQEEGPQHRRRVAAAWMLFHVARIGSQLSRPGKSRAESRAFLDKAARLVSRECLPRTWHLMQSLRSGKSTCSNEEGAGQLLRSDFPYVCKLIQETE